MNAASTNKILPDGIYGITAEQFSEGRTNIETVQAMIDGGVSIIQYREKRPYKSHRQMLVECRKIRRMTREAGIPFIVNDYVDIALLCEADGIHVGQDDLPVDDVRRLVGPDMIIGLSTPRARAVARGRLERGGLYRRRPRIQHPDQRGCGRSSGI